VNLIIAQAQPDEPKQEDGPDTDVTVSAAASPLVGGSLDLSESSGDPASETQRLQEPEEQQPATEEKEKEEDPGGSPLKRPPPEEV